MQHRPLSCETKKWCDVCVKQQQITVKGGYNKKGELAESIQYQCADNVSHTFVALHKEAKWFVKGFGGEKKGDLKAVQALQVLRQRIIAADFAPIEAEPCPAVAGSDSQSTAIASDTADDDPMEAARNYGTSGRCACCRSITGKKARGRN